MEKAKHILSVPISPDIHKKLHIMAACEGVFVQDLVTDILKKTCDRIKISIKGQE